MLLIVCCGGMFFSCTDSPVAGGTSETTNGVIASIVKGDNTPAANAVVRLRRADYFSPPPALSKRADFINADTVIREDTVTDKNGRFEINGIEPGDYVIEVTDSSTSAVLLECTIHNNDTTNLKTHTLKPFASITGIVDSMTSGAYVQVRGMERLLPVDSTGRFVINDLPAATLDLRIIASGGQKTEINKLKVASGDTTPVAVLPYWRYAQQLILNTTATGANVAEDVTAFPLLVRLNATNFDFSLAQVSGQDIRFMKTDGTILPYEIEEWNATEKRAASWVKIDTVYGNNQTQAFMMLWGNAAAAHAPRDAAVFDTALGYRAVFHLNDDSNLSDASTNLNNGINYGAQKAVGIIGGALGFSNGETTYVTFPHKDNIDAANLLESESGCTFSWWMQPFEKLDTISGGVRRDIISKGVGWGKSVDQDWAVFISEDTLIFEAHSEESTELDKFATAGTPNASWDAQKWYHIVFAYDGKTVQWFINGEPDGPEVSFDYAFDTSNDKTEITIGRHNGMSVDGVFDGILDEIRIENVRRSAGWVKLSYMNQKADNPLVKFD